MNNATRRLVQLVTPKNNKSGVIASGSLFTRSCSTPNLQWRLFQGSDDVSFATQTHHPLRKIASINAGLSRSLSQCSIDHVLCQPTPEEPVAHVASNHVDDNYWDAPSHSSYSGMTVARKEARELALLRVQEGVRQRAEKQIAEVNLKQEAERLTKEVHASSHYDCDSEEYWCWDTTTDGSGCVAPSMPLHQQTSDASPANVSNYWDTPSDSPYNDTTVARKEARDLAVFRVKERARQRREEYWFWDASRSLQPTCARSRGDREVQRKSCFA